MSKFVKPNNDRVFYLYSDKATKLFNNTGVISSVTLGAGGTNYTSTGSIVSITAFSGSGASITPIITGALTSVVVDDGGDGYTSASVATATLGTGATITPTIIGGITSIGVSVGGSGFVSIPIVTITGGGGTGAVYTATVAGGLLTGLVKTTEGSGYTSAPTVSFSLGTGATVVPVITGSILSITASGGTGYTSLSTVSITVGTGAITTPTVTGPITSYVINNGGTGYVSPVISISVGSGATPVLVLNTPSICYEYRWNINDINLNDGGKLSLVNHFYKSMVTTTTPVITRILNLSSKEQIDTSRGVGSILDISSWNYLAPFIPPQPIYLSPQTINNFTITLEENMQVLNVGSSGANVFCLVLKLTEGDLETVQFGSTNNINVNQRQIQYY